MTDELRLYYHSKGDALRYITETNPVIKYEGGYEWVKLNTDITAYSLRDENNNSLITVVFSEEDKQLYVKQNNVDDYAMFIEQLAQGLEAEKITGIQSARDDTGKLYIGYDSILEASENNNTFTRDNINIPDTYNYAISNEGQLYVGMDNINYASDNGATFNKNNVHVNIQSSMYENGPLYVGEERSNQYEYEIMQKKLEEGKPIDIKNIPDFMLAKGYATSKSGRVFLGYEQMQKAVDDGVRFEKVSKNLSGAMPENKYEPESWAISKTGKLYLGIDEIKHISQHTNFSKVHISPDDRRNEKALAVSTNGKLFVGEDAVNKIPKGTVLASATIKGTTNITVWSHKVIGDFNASDSNLSSLNGNACFKGNAIFDNCKKLKSFEEKVYGNFSAENSRLTSLDAKKIKGNINIKGTELAQECGFDEIKADDKNQYEQKQTMNDNQIGFFMDEEETTTRTM
ncbi:hypothetical protein ACTOI6_18920 (plasmid) [Komagataeibacter intermedius]|uniref:hypothetical protein n=1 Tax=Komagataeibacter intermedius TaxID=66229 RepID=UPI00403554FA